MRNDFRSSFCAWTVISASARLFSMPLQAAFMAFLSASASSRFQCSSSASSGSRIVGVRDVEAAIPCELVDGLGRVESALRNPRSESMTFCFELLVRNTCDPSIATFSFDEVVNRRAVIGHALLEPMSGVRD
jgi:hypothetical protein